MSDITRKVLLPRLSIKSTFLFSTILHGLRYDDRKFNAGAILFGENLCKKKGISSFKLCFRFAFGLNLVKYAGIMITHVCFIASGDV